MKKLTTKQKLYNFWHNDKFKKVRDVIMFVSLGINILIFLLFGIVSCSTKPYEQGSSAKQLNTQLVHKHNAIYPQAPFTIPTYSTIEPHFNNEDWSYTLPTTCNLDYEINVNSVGQKMVYSYGSYPYTYVCETITDLGFHISVNDDNSIVESSTFYIVCGNIHSFNYTFISGEWSQKTFEKQGNNWVENNAYTIRYIDINRNNESFEDLLRVIYNLTYYSEFYYYQREYNLIDLNFGNLVNSNSNNIFDFTQYGSIDHITGNVNSFPTDIIGSNQFLVPLTYYDNNFPNGVATYTMNLTYKLSTMIPGEQELGYNDYLGRNGLIESMTRTPNTWPPRYAYFNGSVISIEGISSYNSSYVKTYSGTFYDNEGNVYNGTYDYPLAFTSNDARIILNCSFMYSYPESPLQVYDFGEPKYNTYYHFDIMKNGNNSSTPSGTPSEPNSDNFNSVGLIDVFGLLGISFIGISALLNIQVLPAITIGALVFAPLVVTIIIAIIRLIRK